MKSRTAQTPINETPADNWRKDIEIERLRLERRAAEDRRTETVARLAIELARARAGRPGKNGGHIVPDVEGAVRLLAESESARLNPRSNNQGEDLLTPLLEDLSPSLRWHKAKRGEEPGSGGIVSASVLCDESQPPDFKIHVGFNQGSRWHEIGVWEVLRNERVFRQIIESALASLRAKKKTPKGKKLPAVTSGDIEEVLRTEEIGAEFFKELVETRKSLGKAIPKGSASGEARPPRGKRKASHS